MITGEPSQDAFALVPEFRGDSAALAQIVEMLKRGQDVPAKAKLAEFINKYPNDPRAIELAGTIFLQEKNYPLAASSFNRARLLSPTNYRILSKLGVALFLQGDKEKAEAVWNKTIALHANDALARRYLGWLDETRGNLEGAARHYRAAIVGGDLPPGKLTEVHLALGRVYNALGKYADTAALLAPFAAGTERGAAFDAARFQLAYAYLDLQRNSEGASLIHKLETTLKPDDVDLLFLKTYSQLRSRPADGRQKLQALIESNPAYARRARLWIARSYALEGNSKAAAQELEALATHAEPSDLPEILMALSAVQISAGKPQDAARVLDGYARKHPEMLSIRYLLAELRVQGHDFAGAESLLKALLVQNPNFAQAYALSGQIARARGNLSAAEADLRNAVSLDSGLVDAWVNLAGVRVSSKDLPGAESVLNDGLNRNPNNPTLQYELAGLYDEMGKWREANAYYRTVLAAYPSHVPSLNNLALNLAEQEHDVAGARKLAEKAYLADKRSPGVQDTYGWILVLDNDAAQGLPLLKKAASGSPGDAAVSYHLGVAMIKTGKTREGKRLLQSALAAGLPENLRQKAQALAN